VDTGLLWPRPTQGCGSKGRTGPSSCLRCVINLLCPPHTCLASFCRFFAFYLVIFLEMNPDLGALESIWRCIRAWF
jgi:hypothetical protein